MHDHRLLPDIYPLWDGYPLGHGLHLRLVISFPRMLPGEAVCALCLQAEPPSRYTASCDPGVGGVGGCANSYPVTWAMAELLNPECGSRRRRDRLSSTPCPGAVCSRAVSRTERNGRLVQGWFKVGEDLSEDGWYA